MTAERQRTVTWSDPMALAGAAAGKSGLEFLRAIASGALTQPPMGLTLGFALVQADEGYARFEGTTGEYQYNPMATVHGGWACTILDSAMGCAVMTTCDAESAYTTAQLNVNLVKAITAATGKVTCEARILARGNRVATAEGTLVDARGTVLAHGTTTCLILSRRG